LSVLACQFLTHLLAIARSQLGEQIDDMAGLYNDFSVAWPFISRSGLPSVP
jgi:hypothetical protein